LIRIVADTHVLLWAVLDESRLSPSARRILGEAGPREVAVSSITLVELVCLEEKGRIRPEATRRIFSALAATESPLVEVPLDSSIVTAMRNVPRSDVPDLPDRIIAATALHLGVPVVTRDGKIRSSALTTIW
jgi:PIN domain nuclease of toxin-antitoxin system